MPERISAQIKIGGTLTTQKAIKLIEAIANDSAALEYGSSVQPSSIEEILKNLDDEGHLNLVDDQAAWGEFDQLEGFLVSNEIAFDRQSERKDEYDAELVRFRPGMKEPLEEAADSEGNLLIASEKIEEALTLLRKGFTNKLDDHLVSLLKKEIAPLPPLRVIE